jgi:hypothetical protein
MADEIYSAMHSIINTWLMTFTVVKIEWYNEVS